MSTEIRFAARAIKAKLDAAEETGNTHLASVADLISELALSANRTKRRIAGQPALGKAVEVLRTATEAQDRMCAVHDYLQELRVSQGLKTFSFGDTGDTHPLPKVLESDTGLAAVG